MALTCASTYGCGPRRMIDVRKNGQSLRLGLGLEPVHRFLRPVAAAYRYQSVYGHGLHSPQAENRGQGGEDSTCRQKSKVFCHDTRQRPSSSLGITAAIFETV